MFCQKHVHQSSWGLCPSQGCNGAVERNLISHGLHHQKDCCSDLLPKVQPPWETAAVVESSLTVRFTPWQLAEAISEEGKEAWSKPAALLPVECAFHCRSRATVWVWSLWLLGSWFYFRHQRCQVIEGAQWEGTARSLVPGVSQGPSLATRGAITGPTQSQHSWSSFHRTISYEYCHSCF